MDVPPVRDHAVEMVQWRLSPYQSKIQWMPWALIGFFKEKVFFACLTK